MKPPIGDFECESEHAEWLGRKPRALRRMRQEPDGLPHTSAGRTILYKREWTLAWLEGRRKQNNPTAPTRTRRSAMRDRGAADARPAR